MVKDFLKELLKRLRTLLMKILSIKVGIGLTIATVTFFLDIMPWYGWFFVYVICVSVRMFEKIALKAMDKGISLFRGK